MVHENSDDGTMYKRPLGHREGRPLQGLMTLQNFADGGYDVVDARILVVVKSLGQRKKSTYSSPDGMGAMLMQGSRAQRRHHDGKHEHPSSRRHRRSHARPLGHTLPLSQWH